MNISIVVAMSSNSLIGRDGDLPWHLSADLQHFKSITMGKPILMGRKTHESIGRPLPGRENIVLTRNKDYRANGCTVINQLNELESRFLDSDELMIIGGAQLYADALEVSKRLFITEVHADLEGDTYFPEFDRGQWREIERQAFKADEKNDFDYSFVVLERL
ncbi:MAG: dihydrofolate reductase [Gammaproteobacteria bacterium]|jgi:dihydrofolate reductase|nr:dihydrofolate reductase [Gammaproteobacteria bacterium]